ncbi:MAG: hypothetical protein MJ231_07825 [bacterium]|nr:hypothetical protein [bacterium]
MTKINLLAIQLGSEIDNFDSNVQKAQNLMECALQRQSADFVFLPEVWTCGWDCESFLNFAETVESSKAIKMLKNIAKKYNVNIIGGSLIIKKDDGTYVNACSVVNRNGELVCTYEKNHLFSYYGDNEGDYITRGDNPVMVELDGIKIGLTICYDIRFPEIYRAYRIAGADILVNMAAWGAKKKIPWDSMTTARAVENQTYFVALTQTGTLRNGEKNLGHSMIIDYKGDIMSEIDKIEGSISATVDLAEMYQFRDKCTVLNDIQDSYEVLKI